MANPKTFTGLDDKGIPFAIQYTNTGVKWFRGDRAKIFAPTAQSPAPTPSIPSVSATPSGAVAALADAMAEVGLWWETRQRRLLDAAAFEEDRRIPWTLDMMERWWMAHRDGHHVDLRVSNFLAREANATMRALLENKKMAVPQSMLYELEVMRQGLSLTRQALLAQFEELHASSLDVGLALNMGFVRRMGADPVEEWVKTSKEKAPEKSSQEFAAFTDDRDRFVAELFNDRLPAISKAVTKSALARLAGRLADFADMASGVLEPVRAGAAIRRNEYRELSLFSTEAVRTSALHSAWGVVNDLMEDAYGIGVIAVEIDGQLTLRTSEKPLQSISAAGAVPKILGT